MEREPKTEQKPLDSPEDGGEAGISSLEAIKGTNPEVVSVPALPDLDILVGLEELYPGFIELVLTRMPEIKLETIRSHLSATMQEVATELGKDKLAEIVATRAASEANLLDSKALIRLEALSPGFIELMFLRMQEIQQIELDTTKDRLPRKFGRTIAGIFRKTNHRSDVTNRKG